MTKHISKAQALKMVTALTKCKQYLRKDYRALPRTSQYICVALFMTKSADDVLTRLESLIGTRMAPYTTMEEWLGQHVPSTRGMDSHQHMDAVQSHRHAWVDHLIEELTLMSGSTPMPPMQKSTSPMTLEDAILHAKEKAHGDSDCAMQHAMLADWLSELQVFRLTYLP